MVLNTLTVMPCWYRGSWNWQAVSLCVCVCVCVRVRVCVCVWLLVTTLNNQTGCWHNAGAGGAPKTRLQGIGRHRVLTVHHPTSPQLS